jgi:hypothetical protein
MRDNVQLYTLLYVDDRQDVIQNKIKIENPALSTYLPCAMLLRKSCALHGINVKILTNNAHFLNEELSRLGKPPIAIEIDFPTDIPRSINYYAAHYKLDALRALGSGDLGNRVALLDCDIVMLRGLPDEQSSWREDVLNVYDLSPSVAQEFGEDYVAEDVELLTGLRIPGARWFGGEFIAGSPAAFRLLMRQIDTIWPNYVRDHAKTRHEGDEMVVSAALNVLSHTGRMTLIDIGAKDRRWIGRWFSARTGYKQDPLAYHMDCALLHVPCDKDFLAAAADKPFDVAGFRRDFWRYAARKLRIRTAVNFIDRLSGRRRFVSDLR